MIRENIKLNYLEADKIFLKHRNIDQSNYRVGILNNSVIVWNPDTMIFMDFFYDDKLDQEWFNLSLIGEKGTYKINRAGKVIGPKGKLLTLLYDPWGYPNYKISGKHPKIHNLIARMFIPNIDPENKIVIDHIDRNKDNFSLENLRWVTIKENANNLFRPNWTGKHLYKAFSDINHKNLIFELSDEEFYEKYGGSKIKGKIISSKGSYKVESYYWLVDNLSVSDYLNMINVKHIDNSLWVLHYTGKFKIHPLGLVFTKKTGLSVGHVSSDTKFHPERKFGKFRIHILVAEVFLNNNNPIPKGMVIDHLNTNSLDNRVENLKICTQSENMSNPLTVKKLSRKIIDKNNKIFDSITDCAKYYGVSTQAIWARLNNYRPNHGFRYYEDN